jgi:hypothetical protein
MAKREHVSVSEIELLLSEIERLRAQRDQLLAALRGTIAAYDADWSKHGGDYETGITRAMRDARAAIAAVEEKP